MHTYMHTYIHTYIHTQWQFMAGRTPMQIGHDAPGIATGYAGKWPKPAEGLDPKR